MADPVMQVFDRCKPLVMAGTTVTIGVNQTLTNNGTPLLEQTSADTVKVFIDGPRLRLTPADISGVYPAPGSEESPDEFLPHIAITRRTLPWERQGPAAGAPWLALLLFKESELKSEAQRAYSPKVTLEATTIAGIQAKDAASYTKFTAGLGLTPDTSVNVLYVPNNVLPNVLPKANELQYLCHMKRKTENGVDTDTAIVLCNRLPDSGPEGQEPQIHTAVLVSLEKRTELYQAGYFNNQAASTALIALHSWTFKPNKGGDFEQVIQSIGYRPNGGVLRFGNLPQAPPQGQQPPLSGGFDALLDTKGFFIDPLPHAQEGDVAFRGPLRPFKSPARSNAFAIRSAPEEFAQPGQHKDFSHAAAFEIGRLLAASDSGVLEDIRDIHVIHQVIEPPLAVNKMPPALQKPDWVSNPATWFEQPWEMSPNDSMIKDENLLFDKGVGDVTGINEHVSQWGDILVDIASMPVQQMPPVVAVDIGTMNGIGMGKQFPSIEIAGKS